MHRDKSLKQFKLHQIQGEEYSLNVSGSNANLLTHSLSSYNLSTNVSPSSMGLNRRNSPAGQSTIKAGRYLHFHKQSQKEQQSSLVKSKEMLEKFTSKLSSLPLHKYPHSSALDVVRNQIQQTTNEITRQIDKKIDQSFTQILNSNTIIPMSAQVVEYDGVKEYEKENSSDVGVSMDEGTRLLMKEYWQKEGNRKPSTSPQQHNDSEEWSLLPRINQKGSNGMRNQKVILGRVNRVQKKLQQSVNQKNKPNNQQILQLKVNVIDYKIENETEEFLQFQRLNFKRWEDVLFVLNCIEKFCMLYDIREGRVLMKRVLELVDDAERKENLKAEFNLMQKPRGSPRNKLRYNVQGYREYTTHQLLSCFEDAEEISQSHTKAKGIRYFGATGRLRAIVKIQSHFRRYLAEKRLFKLKGFLEKIVFIQRRYRSYASYMRTKALINQNQHKRLQKFKILQESFRQNYRQREMTRRVKYQIHVCSMGGSEWLRVTTENINERQNMQLSRIYRIATKSTPLIETRVVYIAPCELSKDIVNYYKKIFEFGSQGENNYEDRLTILWPEKVDKLPDNLTLTQKILYSKQTMARLRRIIRNNYCYIVPSAPSNDFITLSTQLNIPLYSTEPQKLLYLQTQAGIKQFASSFDSSQDQSIGRLPYSCNIYNKVSFINELAFLVFSYPEVRRWVLKIDNERNSRGLAYIDTGKIIKLQLVQQLLLSEKQKQKQLKQQVYNRLYQSLITFNQQRIVPVSKQLYQSQQQYLNHFLAYGGMIEAAINDFESDLINHCFVVEIEPDSQWRFVTCYQKITHKNKTIGAFYNGGECVEPPIQIESMVKELLRKMLFGFFTFEFLQMKNTRKPLIKSQDQSSTIKGPKNGQKSNLRYFNGIKCHLDEFSSASFLKEFLSRDTNVLYVPFLSHPSLKELRIQTFFHLCRLENISFDIKRKIGNVFMFLSGLQTGCMGVMSFNGASRQETFEQVSDVLQFLSSKLNQTKINQKNVPRDFMAIRNVVNGYLKREKDRKLAGQLKQSKSTTAMHRTLSSKLLL